MANKYKQKGDRAERAVVELLRSYGLDAYRIPLSGSVQGFKSDIEVRLPDGELRLESKVRALGFGRIYKWLIDNDALIIKADRKDPLVVLNLRRFARLLASNSPQSNKEPRLEPSPDPLPNTPQLEPQPLTNYGVLSDIQSKPYTVVVNAMRSKPL